MNLADYQGHTFAQRAKSCVDFARSEFFSPPFGDTLKDFSDRSALMAASCRVDHGILEHAKALGESLRPLVSFEFTPPRGIGEIVREMEEASSRIRELMNPLKELNQSFSERVSDLLRPFAISNDLTRRVAPNLDFGSFFDRTASALTHCDRFKLGAGIHRLDEIDFERDSEAEAEKLGEANAPVDTDSPEVIRSYAPSLATLKRLFSRGIDLNRIAWRDLEEIVSELLEFDGYAVELGRGSKDGGVDVLAWKIVPNVGLFRTVWQAKHLKSGNKVGLNSVRELADIRREKNATKAFIVTSAYLTRGAQARIRQDAYCLGKVERPELERWIANSLKPGYSKAQLS